MSRAFFRAQRLLTGLADYGLRFPQRAYLDVRASYTLEAYRRRRDRYASEARRLGLTYDDTAVRSRTAQRLQRSGVSVRPRARGDDIHTLAYFPNFAWHAQLLPPLRELGPLSYFDYNEHGLRTADLYARRPVAVEQRRRAFDAFERFAAAAAKKRPVDWVFVYALGIEMTPALIDRVRAITGAPVVGMCFDDKQSWQDEPFGGEPSGQVVFAHSLDLAWTSARVACDWYLVEAANPIFLGEGCSPDVYRPAPVEQDHDACFVGTAYGIRSWYIRQLRDAGIRVTTAGHGWPEGPVTDAETIALMRRSKVVLGLGGIGWSVDLKNVKGRDFDAPCVGAYATSFNPDLAEMFRVGEEIACYSAPHEAVEVVRDLLAHPEKRRRLAERGRARCVAEHTWRHRFETILERLGILAEPGVGAEQLTRKAAAVR